MDLLTCGQYPSPEHMNRGERMSVGKRLRAKRVAAKLSLEAAGKVAGVSKGQFMKYELDKNQLPIERAELLETGLGWSKKHLLFGEEELVPVVGEIIMGGLARYDVTIEPYAVSAVHGLIPADVNAFLVSDNTMAPACELGDIIYVSTRSYPPERCIGKDCICALGDGRQLLRRVMPGRSENTFILQAHSNGQSPMVDMEVKFARPVVAVRRNDTGQLS